MKNWRKRVAAILHRGQLRAVGDRVNLTLNTPADVSPLGNDRGSGLRITRINNLPVVDGGSTVDVGSLTVELNDGVLTLTPDNGFTGSYAFTYVVTDGQQSRVAVIQGSVV